MLRSFFLPIWFGTLLPISAFADEALPQAAGDMLWLVVAGALVFFMQAGFALIEGGMTRAKNAINVIMKNYTDVCVGSLAFWIVGFGLMFGDNASGWFGATHFMLNDVDPLDYGLLFFQTMFAATSVTIASGAMAERTKFGAYLIGAIIICAVIYPVYGSWVWGSLYEGSGWLSQLGFIDFAGSTVVHSVGGWVALAGIIVLGPRLGRFDESGRPRTISGHNLTLVALGGFVLWLGWFGFNAGSTTEANLDIGKIALNTHLAASAGVVGSLMMVVIMGKPVLSTHMVNGSLGGLVGITAGCATMDPIFAVVTGLLAGAIVVMGIYSLELFGFDDVVGAVSVHGIAGAWGTLAAGIFYVDNPFNVEVILVQLIGIAAGFLWAFCAGLIMYFAIDKLIGLRASTQDEQRGLDFTEHYEVGYPEFQAEQLHEGKK